jgi:hypothetical protein
MLGWFCMNIFTLLLHLLYVHYSLYYKDVLKVVDKAWLLVLSCHKSYMYLPAFF